jgi:adenine phosphoribosyltransferase
VSGFHDELVARVQIIHGHADVLGAVADAGLLARAAAALAAPFAGQGVTKVAGLEARGFIFGAAAALELGAGFVPVRKPGGIHPGDKARAVTAPSWRGKSVRLEVQRAAIQPGDRVLLVDDWAETGAQALTAKELIEECGGEYVGLSLLVDQLSDETRSALAPVSKVADAAELRWLRSRESPR